MASIEESRILLAWCLLAWHTGLELSSIAWDRSGSTFLILDNGTKISFPEGQGWTAQNWRLRLVYKQDNHLPGLHTLV